MTDIYSQAVDSLRAGRLSVIATIIERRGSSPRGIGTKMLIMEDGVLSGSVGGGELEREVIDAASQVFSSAMPVLYKSGKGMSCGGDLEVLLEPVSPDDDIFYRICMEISKIVKRGGTGLMATVTDPRLWKGGQVHKALFKSDGEVIGELPNMQEAFKAVTEGMTGSPGRQTPGTIRCTDGDGIPFSIFIEPIISSPVLYVFGAGHVSSHVVPFAGRVGFRVAVIDDRPGLADPRRFPEAEKVLNCPYDDVLGRLPINGSSYIVIMTRGHSLDETVLSQALLSEAGYIGMIGSRRKISAIYENLRGKGFTERDLERVHSPIGLDIGAETPEEIALSIVAELVKVRAG